MKAQDIVILLKILALDKQEWRIAGIAEKLKISSSTVFESLERNKAARLLDSSKKKVQKGNLLDFLEYGIKYVFPTEPTNVKAGIPTAHSAPPLSHLISAKNDVYVWAVKKAKSEKNSEVANYSSIPIVMGQSIEPLHKCVVSAVKNDAKLYEMLTLIDAIRVGRTRERNLAIEELKKLIK